MIPSLVDDDSSPVVASRRRGGGGGSRRERDDTSNRSHDLAGVQQSLRIESLLDRAHDGHGLGAVFLFEIADLAVADAVLAGAGAAHGQGAADEAVVDLAGDAQFGRVVRVDDIDQMRSEEHTSELQSLLRSSYAVFCCKKK